MSTVAPEQTLAPVIEIMPFEEPADPSKHKAHIVNPPHNLHIWEPGMTSQDIVDTARLLGLPLVALCWYTWVPKMNPDKLEACEECVKRAHELLSGADE